MTIHMQTEIIKRIAQDWLEAVSRGDFVRAQQLSFDFDTAAPCGFESRNHSPVFTYRLPNSKRRVVSRSKAIEAWAQA